MTTTRNTRQDVVSAAGRLFARRGYHGTSMRDLGQELGLLGSSLYSHVTSKEDLLVEVVEKGAGLFEQSARRASKARGSGAERLRNLIAGHVDVMVDHLDEVRTFLNEARFLEPEHRRRIVAARDAYEAEFRAAIADGLADGSLAWQVDPKLGGIMLLSILNALERWYDPQGALDRRALVERIWAFVAP
ncbi:MAG TPA: TetR/AcrR family transcriptional regulator, partial [Longimicrobiales bacterium]|nr:TetR/AcrR family transcriptional regulator [Longimicrobiales bacterium]